MPSTAAVTQRPFERRLATLVAAKSICHISQPPKMSPEGLVSAGMVVVRITGGMGGGVSASGVATVMVVLSMGEGLERQGQKPRPPRLFPKVVSEPASRRGAILTSP